MEEPIKKRATYEDIGAVLEGDMERLAFVVDRAIEAFGEAKAHGWLHVPCTALGGKTPLSLLITEDGMQSVLDEIERIESSVSLS